MARAPIHPGEHLAEELKELQMSAAELSRQLKVPTNRITGILNGQRAIAGDTALRLAHFFATSAQFWLNLQALYELRLAEQKAGKASALKARPRFTRSTRGTCEFIDRRHCVQAAAAVRADQQCRSLHRDVLSLRRAQAMEAVGGDPADEPEEKFGQQTVDVHRGGPETVLELFDVLEGRFDSFG